MTSHSDRHAEPVLLTDRTTIETDWTCGMRRWWYKEENGTGIVPVATPAALEVGTAIHTWLADLGRGDDPRDVLRTFAAREPFPDTDVEREVWARLLGWVALWSIAVEPVLRLTEDTVAIEKEFVLERDPLWIAMTPDRVVRSKVTGKLRYREWKSASVASGSAGFWAEYWPHAVQLHLGIAAVEEALGEPVEWGQVTGLLKGEERDGRLRSPFTYAYRSPAGVLGGYKYGYDLVPVWEAGGPAGSDPVANVVGWVESGAGFDSVGTAAATVFPRSRVVFKDDRLVRELVAARIERERVVAAVRKTAAVDKTLRALYFEQRFTQCRPMRGPACPYVLACHNAAMNAAPLSTGAFVARTPHHDLETLKLIEEGVLVG